MDSDVLRVVAVECLLELNILREAGHEELLCLPKGLEFAANGRTLCLDRGLGDRKVRRRFLNLVSDRCSAKRLLIEYDVIAVTYWRRSRSSPTITKAI